MDKNNFSIIDAKYSHNIDLFDILEAKQSIIDNTIKVFNEMPSLGIFNPYVLLDLIVENKVEYLKDFFKKKKNILIFNFNKEKLNYNFVMKNEKIFYLKQHLKDGSYHNIYLINHESEINDMILRKQKDNSKVDFFDSCSDFFIHAFLSLYQNIIKQDELIIPKIHYLGINNKTNKFMGIMNLYNGTIFDLLMNKNIKNKTKILIIYKCLEEITYYLILLQKKFRFNHNDLKINNIFYKLNESNNYEDLSNINFYLADFGFSRIKIYHPKTKERVRVIGGALLNYSKDKDLYSFIPSKDLYFLIHNIYAYSNSSIKKSLDNFVILLGDFNIDLTIDNNWLKIYDDKIKRNNYIPENFFSILQRHLSKPQIY